MNDQINLINFKDNNENSSQEFQFICTESIIVDEDPNRIWKFIRDLTYLPKVSKNLCSELTYLNKKKLFELNSEVSFYNINLQTKAKTSKIGEDLLKIFIERYYEVVNIKYFQTTYIYPVSDYRKSLVRLITRCPIKNNPTITFDSKSNEYFKRVREYILQCYQKYILSSSEHFENYESCIINNYNNNHISDFFDYIWNFVIDLSNLSKIKQTFGENFEKKGPSDKKGTFWKFQVSQNIKEKHFLIVKDVINNSKRNWRLCIIEPFGSNTYFPKQEIHIKVTKVNNNCCQVSYMNIFKQTVNHKFLDLIRKKKIYLLKQLKKFFEEKK